MSFWRWASAIWIGVLLGIYAGDWLHAQPQGFSLRGRFTATESEATERYVNFGKAFAWAVNDPALWANIQPLIGRDIIIVVEMR